MTRIRTLLALLCLCLPAPVHSEERDEERSRAVYLRDVIEIKIGGSAEKALKVYNDWGGGPGERIPEAVMQKMYEAAGGGTKAFKTIALLIDKGLPPESLKDKSIKTRKIANEHSIHMAEMREAWIEDIIFEIGAEKGGDWKVARSDSGNVTSGMKSDLDQTFYIFKKGPDGKWIRDLDADAEFIETFNKKWGEKHPTLSLDALDLASIDGKNRFPDPRDVWLDFEGKFVGTSMALFNTPGAYTYGGAVAQQMQFRALVAILSGNERAFQQYEPGPDGKMRKIPFDEDAALRHMFGLLPDLRPAHAYGASVANFLELQKYMGKEKFESKYHLRTWEDGGLPYALEQKLKGLRKEYMDLDGAEREAWNERIIDPLFADPQKRKLHRLAMDASADLRLVHKGKFDQVFPDGDPGNAPARDAVIFEKIARQMFDLDPGTKPSKSQIKAASWEHRRLASEYCLETVYKTAEEAFKVSRDTRYKDPLSVDGYKHLMTGVKDADWPRVKRNIQTANRLTLLYSIYDLGAWKSAVLMKRLSKQFPDVGWGELGRLWLKGRVQRWPDVSGLMTREVVIDFSELGRREAARFMKGHLGRLHERVQRHVLSEVGFKNVEKAKVVNGLLRGKNLTWSPAKLARNMVWDPGSIDALAQIVRAYVTSEGDMEHVKAVVTNEIILAIPVAGQLVSATQGGITGLVLMAGAIQFPVLGIGMVIYSVGEAGYAIYDTEYAQHKKNNLVDAIYRGFAGPATRAYDNAPPQFTERDAHLFKILAERLRRATAAKKTAEIKELTPRVAELRAKRDRWKDFRDGSWAGGYFSQWGAIKEQKPVPTSLLVDIPPIISFSPAGLIDFRAAFDPETDPGRIETMRKELESIDDVELYLDKSAEVDELVFQQGRYERAQRYLKAAVGDRDADASLTEREKRQGVPELLFKIRRDSLYPALMEWAKRRKREIGNLAQANPDRYVDWWLKEQGRISIAELAKIGLVSGATDPDELPVQEIKDRLTNDLSRSKNLYHQFLQQEERRKEQARIRKKERLAAYQAESAGLFIENLDQAEDADARREFLTALPMAVVVRQPPKAEVKLYVVRGEKPEGDRLLASVRLRVDPAVYPPPYDTVVHQLKGDGARRALSSGRVDDVPLTDASKNAIRAGLGQGDDVVIPVVSVFGRARRDLTGALPQTIARLPAERTARGILLDQVVPGGPRQDPEEELEEPEPEPTGTVRVMIRRSKRTSIARVEVTLEEPTPGNCNTAVLSKHGHELKPVVLVRWPDMPKSRMHHYRLTIKGGIPPIAEAQSGSIFGAPDFKENPRRERGNAFIVPVSMPGNVAGEITITGELVLFDRRVRLKDVPTATPAHSHPFHAKLQVAPAKIEARGSVSRYENGIVTGSVSLEHIQPGARLLTIKMAGVTRYGIGSGFRVPFAEVPATAQVTLRNYGEDVTVTVPLKSGNVKPPRETNMAHVERHQGKLADLLRRQKDGDQLYFIAEAHHGIASAYEQSGRRAGFDKWAEARTNEMNAMLSMIERMASPKWGGYRYRSYYNKLPSPWRTGDANNARTQQDLRRANYSQNMGRFVEYALNRHRIDLAQEFLRHQVKLADAVREPRWKANAYGTLASTYRKLSRTLLEVTGSLGASEGAWKQAEEYRSREAGARGKPFRPSTFPHKIDPAFADGG